MATRRLGSGWGGKLGLTLMAAAAVCAALPLVSQQSLAKAPEPARSLREPALPGLLPRKPSQPPAFTIPVEPLGFSPPSIFYLGMGESFVSLDFLDENRLLFTFRVPGLIRRGAGEEDARQIRALVLDLPTGTVAAEAQWTLHGGARYLWK
ncbi:MAG: hypothetical protein ACP5FH_04080, partial [Terracidiphilus sp.]